MYQPNPGSTGTGMMQSWQFQPYETPYALSNEYTNVEAGSSNLAPPLVSYVTAPHTHPSGGSSEVTADAVNIQTITEEEAAPVSNLYCSRAPHVTE